MAGEGRHAPLLDLEGDSPTAAEAEGYESPLQSRASPSIVPMISPRLTSITYRRGTYPRSISACALAEEATHEKAAEQKRTQRKLIAALALAFIFMIVEVVAGIYAHSLAVITDAAHLLSDVSGFAISVFAAFWVAKKSHTHFSYGYHRVEVLGALASVLMIWLVTGILVVEAIQRVIHPEDVNGKIMFIVALSGIGVNVLMMVILGGHHHHGIGGHHHHDHDDHEEHSHSHAHSHANGTCSHGHGHNGGRKPLLKAVNELSRSSSITASEQQIAEYQQQQQQQQLKGGAAHAHSHGSECGDDHHSHHHSEDEHPDLEAGGEDSSSRLMAAAAVLGGASDAHAHTHHHHGGDGEGGCCGGHAHSHGGGEVEHQHVAGGHSRAAHSHGHGHSHGHSHSHNINLRGAIIHVIGDLVQSIGVALAGALIWWHQDNPKWHIVDPICTFIFAALVMWTTFTILRDIADVLMERVPRGLCINTINDDLSRVDGVEEVHDLHVWSLTPGIPLLCAHVSLEADADATDTLHGLTSYCRRLGIEHSTFQLVHDGGACPCAC